MCVIQCHCKRRICAFSRIQKRSAMARVRTSFKMYFLLKKFQKVSWYCLSRGLAATRECMGSVEMFIGKKVLKCNNDTNIF